MRPIIHNYNPKVILEGTLSLLPGTKWLFAKRGTGGTDSSRYCYSVWLRHFVRTAAYQATPLNGTVVELGPGDSLGIGLAAFLTGARRYIALDVVPHANVSRNLAIFSELIQLFRDRVPIPGNKELPLVKPKIADYSFPDDLLPIERMDRNLTPERIRAIAAALRGEVQRDPLVRYVDPAAATSIIPGSADFIFSQAVLEHVNDLAGTYAACHVWLATGGLMSHTIDFKSHGAAREWNGHWVYPEVIWHLIQGRRPYLLNREPCSAHQTLMDEAGFDVLTIERTFSPSRLRPKQLAVRFRELSEEDLVTSGVFVVARKPLNRAERNQS